MTEAEKKLGTGEGNYVIADDNEGRVS